MMLQSDVPSNRRLFPLLLLTLAFGACECDDPRPPARDSGADGSSDASIDVTRPDVSLDGDFDPDASCATATSEAELSVAPVDIIWVVDNSTSMEPAIRQVQSGLNDFAGRISSSGLDYQVVMLSLQGRDHSDRFGVCIPPPLAGDSNCNDGDRFSHVSVDIRSTQPVEQILGTLGQTDGYTEGESKGSAPWRDLLRADSTKTIVVVTDDNSRTCDRPCSSLDGCPSSTRCQSGDPELTPISLENFSGGGNPFNGSTLGPGILTDEYGRLFEGYTFNAIYGWGDERDPNVTCRYPDDSAPPTPGWTYTALVDRTGGVRAQICDQSDSDAWDEFFEAVANRVEETARLACELELPMPPGGMALDPGRVNVLLTVDDDSETFRKVENEAACGPLGGWYYDDDRNPTQVLLCPASCDLAQDSLREAGAARIDVAFGCETLLI